MSHLLKSDFRNGPMTVRIEETVVDVYENGSDIMIIASKHSINDIILTYLRTFSSRSSHLIFI